MNTRTLRRDRPSENSSAYAVLKEAHGARKRFKGASAEAAERPRAQEDFSFFTRALLAPEQPPVFAKKPFLEIGKLRLRIHQSEHFARNKLSDKMGRRDIQFYDLYRHQKKREDVQKLRDKEYPFEEVLGSGEEDPYADLEVDDFNQIFSKPDLVQTRFGQSIRVQLRVDRPAGTLERRVHEHLERVRGEDADGVEADALSCAQSTAHAGAASVYDLSQADEKADPGQYTEEDFQNHTLKTLYYQLVNLHEKFKTPIAELGELYAQCCGQVKRMRDHLKGADVVLWTPLDDLALAEPDESPEFQTLLAEKGWQEIVLRREFLQAEPITQKQILDVDGNVVYMSNQ